MRVTGLNHYNLRAHQPLLDELCRFYVEIVGLSVGDRPPFAVAGYWLYANGHPVLHLAEASAEEMAATEVAGTFAHAAFDCIDVISSEALLALRGIRYRKTTVPEPEVGITTSSLPSPSRSPTAKSTDPGGTASGLPDAALNVPPPAPKKMDICPAALLKAA